MGGADLESWVGRAGLESWVDLKREGGWRSTDSIHDQDWVGVAMYLKCVGVSSGPLFFFCSFFVPS